MILIFVEGVLRSKKDSPIYEGLALYNVLKESKKVTLLSKDVTDAERWLKLSGVVSVDEVMDYSRINGQQDDAKLVDYCRSKGKIQLVITSDVELAKYLLEQGLHCLLFLHPMYIRPEFRPDGRGRKTWDAISEEMDIQQGLFSEDPRV